MQTFPVNWSSIYIKKLLIKYGCNGTFQCTWHSNDFEIFAYRFFLTKFSSRFLFPFSIFINVIKSSSKKLWEMRVMREMKRKNICSIRRKHLIDKLSIRDMTCWLMAAGILRVEMQLLHDAICLYFIHNIMSSASSWSWFCGLLILNNDENFRENSNTPWMLCIYTSWRMFHKFY